MTTPRGVAAALKLSEQIKKHKYEATITFLLLFLVRKWGLLGSNYFVKNPTFDIKEQCLI